MDGLLARFKVRELTKHVDGEVGRNVNLFRAALAVARELVQEESEADALRLVLIVQSYAALVLRDLMEHCSSDRHVLVPEDGIQALASCTSVDARSAEALFRALRDLVDVFNRPWAAPPRAAAFSLATPPSAKFTLFITPLPQTCATLARRWAARRSRRSSTTSTRPTTAPCVRSSATCPPANSPWDQR